MCDLLEIASRALISFTQGGILVVDERRGAARLKDGCAKEDAVKSVVVGVVCAVLVIASQGVVWAACKWAPAAAVFSSPSCAIGWANPSVDWGTDCQEEKCTLNINGTYSPRHGAWAFCEDGVIIGTGTGVWSTSTTFQRDCGEKIKLVLNDGCNNSPPGPNPCTDAPVEMVIDAQCSLCVEE